MNSGERVVGFSILKVVTEQFAIIESSFNEKEEINLNTNLKFAIDNDQRVLVVFSSFKFEHNGIPFLIVETSCQFMIEAESWASFVKSEGTVIVPKGFMTHLSMITVGTARGVLHTKTEGTKFNDFVLPTINVMDIIKEDVVFVAT